MYELRTENGVKAAPIHWDRAGVGSLYREFFYNRSSATLYAQRLSSGNLYPFYVNEVK